MPPQRADLGLLDDRDLLSRHAAGEADAFGELFRRHRDRLWSVALRTLGDPEEAADALQDAMISAFRRASSFRAGAEGRGQNYRFQSLSVCPSVLFS